MSKGKKKAEEGITGVGERVFKAGELTPQEQEQYTRSFQLGQDLESLVRYLSGIGEMPAGYRGAEAQYLQQAGPVGQAYYGQTLAGVQDPYAAFESTLQPQLELTQDFINRQAQQRGLLRSGMPIEAMGRAGVELSIREAQARMAAREAELGRAGELTQYMQAGAGQRLANLANLYQTQQQFGQAGLGRQAGQAQAAGQYWAYPGQFQLGQQAGREAGMWGLGAAGLQAAGTVGAAALAPATGGLSLLALPATQALRGQRVR